MTHSPFTLTRPPQLASKGYAPQTSEFLKHADIAYFEDQLVVRSKYPPVRLDKYSNCMLSDAYSHRNGKPVVGNSDLQEGRVSQTEVHFQYHRILSQ